MKTSTLHPGALGKAFKMTAQEKFETALSLGFALFGLFFLLYPRISADGILVCAALFSGVSALLLIRQTIHSHNLVDLLKAIGALALCVFFFSRRALGVQAVCLVFSLYVFAIGLIVGIEGLMDLHEKSKTGWSVLLIAAGYLALGIVGFLLYGHDPAIVQRLCGAYLLFQGLAMGAEVFLFRFHRGSRAWSFRYAGSLPVYVVAIAPSLILRYARRHQLTEKLFEDHPPKNDQPVNLRVFVHSGLSGDHQFGHMTIAYKGIMYSYGNYDKAEEKLFRTVGPGILFTAPADIYVNNCCVYEQSILFEYGLHITDRQEEKLVSLLEEIFAKTYRWYAPVFEQMPNHARFAQYEQDYASRLGWRTGAKFYKFRSGVWKTYWVFGRNCSLFDSELLHSIDQDVVIPRGINTPGEYFDYFEKALRNPASNVISQTIHTASDPKTLFPTAL